MGEISSIGNVAATETFLQFSVGPQDLYYELWRFLDWLLSGGMGAFFFTLLVLLLMVPWLLKISSRGLEANKKTMVHSTIHFPSSGILANWKPSHISFTALTLVATAIRRERQPVLGTSSCLPCLTQDRQ